MESGIQNESGIIQTKSYVLWTYQFTKHFSNHDGHNIPWFDTHKWSNHLYGRYFDCYHKRSTPPSWNRPSSALPTWRTWPLPQTWEMYLWSRQSGISGSHYRTWEDTYGPSQNIRGDHVGSTKESYQNMGFCQFLELLLTVHQGILQVSKATSWSHQEGSLMEVD